MQTSSLIMLLHLSYIVISNVPAIQLGSVYYRVFTFKKIKFDITLLWIYFFEIYSIKAMN